MLLLVILSYYRLFHPKLFLAILSKNNIWLLVILLLRLLVVINGYWLFFYYDYWWLLMAIGYSFITTIGGY